MSGLASQETLPYIGEVSVGVSIVQLKAVVTC